MPKKPAVKKKAAVKRPQPKKITQQSWRENLKMRYKAFLERRPHRSFRKTSKSAMPRKIILPGFWALIRSTIKTVRTYKKELFSLCLVLIVFNLAVTGVSLQQNYDFFRDTVKTVSESLSAGEFDTLPQAVTIFGLAITGGLSEDLTEAQQIFILLSGIIMWLTFVWYLRNRLNDNYVSVRDALYNASSPLVPMLVLVLVMVLQLLPGALGVVVYSVAQSSGVNGGVELMMFAVAAGLLITLSLYWVISTLFATLIVTIPGTYPFKALRLAGDIMIGRRTAVLLRILGILLLIAAVWLVVLLPVILLASWINISWLPLIPITIQILTAISLLTISTYTYLLYRHMLEGRRSE